MESLTRNEPSGRTRIRPRRSRKWLVGGTLAVCCCVAAYAAADLPRLPTDELRSWIGAARQVIATLRTPELTSAEAASVVESGLQNAPILVRLALGDVVVFDANGQGQPLYPKLVEAGVVRFRLCRFPGVSGGPNEVCLVELADSSKPYEYNGLDVPAPTKTIAAPATAGFTPENRSWANLIVARRKLTRILTVQDSGTNKKQVWYEVRFVATELAASLNISEALFPPETRAAELRNHHGRWNAGESKLAVSLPPGAISENTGTPPRPAASASDSHARP
jgi:hypothetical protein